MENHTLNLTRPKVYVAYLLDVVAPVCDPRPREIETDRPGIQGHSWLSREFKASLG